jgi:hypothetical protein
MRWKGFPELTDKRFFPYMYKNMHLQLQFYAEMCHRVQKDEHTHPYSGKYCEWKTLILTSFSKQMTNTERFLCVDPPAIISCSHICKFRPRNITRISLVTVKNIPHMLTLYYLLYTSQMHGLYSTPADTPISRDYIINMLNNIHWFVISGYNTIKFALKYEEATGQINRQSSFPKTESI